MTKQMVEGCPNCVPDGGGIRKGQAGKRIGGYAGQNGRNGTSSEKRPRRPGAIQGAKHFG